MPYFDNELEEQAAGSDEPQPVDEVPEDVPEAEPLQEDRVIPFEDESQLKVFCTQQTQRCVHTELLALLLVCQEEVPRKNACVGCWNM